MAICRAATTRAERQAFPQTAPSIEALQALPYAAGTVASDPDTVGVVAHDPERAWSGLSFFVPRGAGVAFLIDMEGEVVHRWRHETRYPWEVAELLPTDIPIGGFPNVCSPLP